MGCNKLARVTGPVLVCLLLWGCGYRNPYLTKHQAQHKAARELRPATLEQSGQSAWRRSTALKLRVYHDAAYAKREPNPTRHVSELLERANQALLTSLHLRLEIESVRALPAAAESNDLEAVLVRMAGLDRAEDVDFVLSLIGQDPIMTFSFHQLGRAEWFGKHLAMRCLDDVEEMRAFAEGLDTLSVEARARLYAERKRHKETAVFLHEVGHALGALHVSAEADLMNPNYHHTAVGFAAENLALMRYGMDERAASEEQRDQTALIQRVQGYLASNEWQGWFENERESHLQSLAHALEQHSAAQQTAALAGPQRADAEAQKNQQEAARDDLTDLSEKDREQFQSIEVHRSEQRVNEAYKLVTELADRYRDNFAVQNKACELGMAFRVEPRFIMRYCARMSELRSAAKN